MFVRVGPSKNKTNRIRNPPTPTGTVMCHLDRFLLPREPGTVFFPCLSRSSSFEKRSISKLDFSLPGHSPSDQDGLSGSLGPSEDSQVVAQPDKNQVTDLLVRTGFLGPSDPKNRLLQTPRGFPLISLGRAIACGTRVACSPGYWTTGLAAAKRRTILPLQKQKHPRTRRSQPKIMNTH